MNVYFTCIGIEFFLNPEEEDEVQEDSIVKSLMEGFTFVDENQKENNAYLASCESEDKNFPVGE